MNGYEDPWWMLPLAFLVAVLIGLVLPLAFLVVLIGLVLFVGPFLLK